MSETRAQNAKSIREAASTAADRGAEAVERNSDAASEALRQGGQAAADVARRAGDAGAETLRRSVGAVAQSHQQIAQDAAGRLQEVSRTVAETTQGTVQDIRALMELPAVADRGLQDLHHGINNMVAGVVQSNLRMTQELFRLTSPAAFVELQQRFVRDYMNALMEGSAALVRAVRQTTEQALPPLEQHLRQRAQVGQANRGDYQRAAE